MERSDGDLWKMAVEDEIRSLYEPDTWKVADLPAGRQALETKWVFKICCAREAWHSYEATPMTDDNRDYMGTSVYMIETLPRWGTMVSFIDQQ